MAIEVQNAVKRFGEVTAVNGVTLSLEKERIYGLLGRNGAGKTTLLNLITNRLFPDGGEIRIDGQPAMENDAAQRKIYCMSEKNYYPDDTRVGQLFAWAKLFHPGFDREYADSLCQKFGLKVKGKFKALSTGYATICKLILTLASGADYLLFDEPVLGLDANHRELFYRELLARYGEHPCTMVISTHLIEEVAGVIEQVVVLKEGSLLLDLPSEEIQGYTVSGKASDVERYCRDKKVLTINAVGGLKTASLWGKQENVPPELEAGGLDLQKLFIALTNSEEEMQ